MSSLPPQIPVSYFSSSCKKCMYKILLFLELYQKLRMEMKTRYILRKKLVLSLKWIWIDMWIPWRTRVFLLCWNGKIPAGSGKMWVHQWSESFSSHLLMDMISICLGTHRSSTLNKSIHHENKLLFQLTKLFLILGSDPPPYFLESVTKIIKKIRPFKCNIKPF